MPRLKILVVPWLITTCFSMHCNSLSFFLMAIFLLWLVFAMSWLICHSFCQLQRKGKMFSPCCRFLTFVDLSFTKMQKTTAAENLFLPICRALDQNPKRRRTILPSVKATSNIDIKRLYDHLIHNVVNKSIITTTTTLFNRVFQKNTF